MEYLSKIERFDWTAPERDPENWNSPVNVFQGPGLVIMMAEKIDYKLTYQASIKSPVQTELVRAP